ncbi:helix-turn-helix domain-containing protein [Myceligenerans crystallogenes]|uniref:Helix-turn-helix domain-containing protein n=1 Tax=Myceligenerans crystallogenes TaxID=316335 RepID=A0ABP4ZPA4_9MICO
MAVLDNHTTVPDAATGDALNALAETLASLSRADIVGDDGSRVEMPEDVVALLRDAVTTLATGRAVALTVVDTVLTTQEVADLLGVSRPTVVRLLDEGEIPYTRPKNHRRILLADVLTYRARLRAIQREALREMAEDVQDDDLTGFVRTR